MYMLHVFISALIISFGAVVGVYLAMLLVALVRAVSDAAYRAKRRRMKRREAEQMERCTDTDRG